MVVFWIIGGVALLAVIIFLLVIRNSPAKKGTGANLEENWLNSIINNLDEGVIAYDENFKIIVFNQAAENIFGIKATQVLNQSFTLKIRQGLPPELKPLIVLLFPALATTIIKRSEPGVFPQIIDISFDDPKLDLRVTTNKIVDEKGNTEGYVKLIHDRTRELALIREKSEFITVASHQLRTPLAGANWALENLKKEDLTPQARELVENTTGAINRLLKITNDLLDVAKIEEGQFGYDFKEFDIVPFIEGALTQAKPIADQYQVKLFFEKPEGKLTVMADPAKLGMVIANLLDNALKYNVPNGEVSVKAQKLPEKSYVQISIHDTGIGIPQENLEKLFTKFFRGDNAMKTSVEGTGLGLYIVKNIIRRHGGEMSAESTLNRGTTITFTLPTNQALLPAKEFAGEE